MKRFLIWGIKWTCLSLCGFALCGNMAYVAVSANSLAYDEDSSSDESYTNSNDYTENSFAESDTSVKNFAESNDNDDESYSEPNDYEQPDEIQEAQDNEPETGLKAIQGFGKKSEENIAEKISNPYGVYYTTPKCEDMDDYWGEKHHDSIIFVISKSLDNKENYAIIDITAAINDSLDDTIQVKYNSEKERWEGKGNILLEYDSALGKYVFTNDKIRVCLEEITSESAALYDSSHQQYSYQDPMLEGAFVSEVGMNNGLTVYIYNLYNTKYYCVMLETKDGTTTVIGEKQTLGEYIYNDFTINIDGTEYYIDGVDLDENRIATAIRVYSLLGEDENEYYLKRSEDYFDGALNQDIYSGTYSIKDLNATINLKYDKESELFSYDISVNGTSIDTSSSNLFQEAGIYSNYFLNFVLIGRLDKELFCRLYQVFNRGIWEIQEANVRSKLISDYVRTINDEVLIVHVPSDEDSHRRKSIERNLGDIVNKICERDCSSLNIPWKVNAWESCRSALSDLQNGQAILKGKYSVNHNSKIWDIPIICAVDSKSSN